MAMSLYFSLHSKSAPPFLSTRSALWPSHLHHIDIQPCLRHSLGGTKPIGRQLPTTRALREWGEYEEAVKEKDLARALGLLRSIETIPMEPDESSTEYVPYRGGDLGLFGQERDWEVLDTCLNADDMKLVGSAYAFLKDKGFLPNFGKFRNIGNSL